MKDYILQCKYFGLISKGSESIATKTHLKSPFSSTPLSFDASSREDLRKYPHPHMGYISAADNMGLFHSNSRDELRKHVYNTVEYVTVIRGHSRKLILAPIKCAHAYN